MNSELYFCHLSDLILSRDESTVILEDGTITNIMAEEALLDTQNLNEPLPWVRYTSTESQNHIKQLQKNKFLTMLENENFCFIKIDYHKRLQILSNFFNSEYHDWDIADNKKEISWYLNGIKKLTLNSFSSLESTLTIPNRLVSKTYEIPLPLHFSLLIDPYFENRYSNALYEWVKLLSENTKRDSHQRIKHTELVDFLSSILVDIGGTVIVDNDVINLRADNVALDQSEIRDFSFMIDQKSGLSIQIKGNFNANNHPSVNTIRSLDLSSNFYSRELIQSSDSLKGVIEMHIKDIQMLNTRN